jgi:putative transposase
MLGQPTQQEFIMPYTPEQTGISEQYFLILKEESVWQPMFQAFEEALRIIRDWVHRYNHGRPHCPLGCLNLLQSLTSRQFIPRPRRLGHP